MISLIIIVFFVLVLSIVLFLVAVAKIKDTSIYLKNVPGPPPNILFGNSLDFIAGSKVLLSNLMGYLKKYGETIIIHHGALTWGVITMDYNFVEYILSSSVYIDKSEQYEYLHKWLGTGLLTSTGPKWKTHRKMITPSFHFSILQEFIHIFDSNGNNLIKRFAKETGKERVEISKIISLYALDVICEAAMGVKMNALEETDHSEYVKNIKTMCEIMMHRTFSPLNKIFYPFTISYFKEKRALKVIHGYVDSVINKRIEDNKNIHGKSEDDDCGVKKRLAFLDLLLHCRINGQPLSRKDIRDEVNTFMFEGHDTTSSAITFCLFMLATHPETQKKVFEEQTQIFYDEDLKSCKPTYNQLNEMKYLEMVIKETLRLFPSVPFFARKLAKDLEFNGNLYPKDMNIMIFLFGLQRSSKYFQDPDNFIPERFENNNGTLPFSNVPFSAGPRNCIGQKFAMLEMLSTVSKVIRNFELFPSRPEHKLELASETILISKNGVCLALNKRTLN